MEYFRVKSYLAITPVECSICHVSPLPESVRNSFHCISLFDCRIVAACLPAFALGLTAAPRRAFGPEPVGAAVQLAAARMFSEAFSSRSMTSPQSAHL